jgi:hypothetical protein
MRKDELIRELRTRGIKANAKLSKKVLEAMLRDGLKENKGIIGEQVFKVDYKSKGRYFTMPGTFKSVKEATLAAKKHGINDYLIKEV